jgi:Na+:H+ antiporter, NhaA family
MTSQKYPLESLFGRILSPFEDFLHRTAAGGIVLLAATIAALVLATWLGEPAIHRAWERTFAISRGSFQLELSLHDWVNDALMALFFLLVGLELKREVMVGELSSMRDAALPVVAALGGMVVPALIYAAFNAGTPTAPGWGIPMATDIAFAVGLLVLLGDRVPRSLTIFLTALAIADDLGAVLVIALFYTDQIEFAALRASGALFVLLIFFNQGGLRHPLPYVLVGAMLWFYVLASGVHATIAGVLLALAIPARGAFTPAQFEERIEELHRALHADRADQSTPDDPLRNHRMTSIAEATEKVAAAVQSPLRRIEHFLSPWIAFLVIPIFALANAGIDLSDVKWDALFSSKATLGVMAGLFIGKFVGISLFSAIAVKVGLGRLPAGVQWRHLLGAAWLAGIGFTMSLFISQLAFADAESIEQAKIGILLASFVAGAVGTLWLWIAGRRKP